MCRARRFEPPSSVKMAHAESLDAVKTLLFEHASICGMNDVLTAVVSGGPSDTSEDFRRTISPVFICLAHLRLVTKTCQMPPVKIEENSSTFDLVIEMIDELYQRFRPISVHAFIFLLNRIKLLAFIGNAKNNTSELFLNSLNTVFPQWTDDYGKSLQKKYGITNVKMLHKAHSIHTGCQKFLLQLLNARKNKNQNILDQISENITKLNILALEGISTFVDAACAHLSPSRLELVVSDSALLQNPTIETLSCYLRAAQKATSSTQSSMSPLSNPIQSMDDFTWRFPSVGSFIPPLPQDKADPVSSSLGSSDPRVNKLNIPLPECHLKRSPVKHCIVKLHNKKKIRWEGDVHNVYA